MIETNDNSEQVVLTCECNEKITGPSLVKSANLYGIIFLVHRRYGYFGIICPNCYKTILSKREMDFLNTLKSNLFYDTYAGYLHENPKFRYFSFPYDFHQRLIIKRSNINSFKKELEGDSGFIDDSVIDDFSMATDRYCSYFFSDLAMGPAIALWWFDENDIETLTEIENETRLKVFPRYIVYDPLYTAINNFCWNDYLRLEFLNDMNLPFPIDDFLSKPYKKKIAKNFEFLNILEMIHEKDIMKNLASPSIHTVIYPSLVSKLERPSDTLSKDENEKQDLIKKAPSHEDMANKIWANFNKDYMQELLSQMATGFIDNYKDLSKKTLFSYELVWKLKHEYLEKLFGSVISRYKREKTKREALDIELNVVREAEKEFPNTKIISNDSEINQLKIRIALIAKLKTKKPSFLLLGEKGTGKDWFARAIHEASQIKKGDFDKFIKVECGTKSITTFESKLFGHVKGAFTGADKDSKGTFEEAGDGTVFFDEIGNLISDLQDILLNPIQDRQYQPVGSSKSKKIQAIFIYATNANLDEMVRDGKFRSDLYDRICFYPIHIPPLRERKGDIPLLVEHFIEKYDTGLETTEAEGTIQVTDECMNLLIKYDWPGNVRQLEQTIARIIIFDRLAHDDRSDITPSDLPVQLRESKKGSRMFSMNEEKLPGNMKVADEQVIYWMKKLNNNKSQVANQLSVSYRTILRHCKKLNL